MIQITPLRALLVGCTAYGVGVYWMSKNFYSSSRLRKIYVDADQHFGDVVPMAPRDLRPEGFM